MANAYKHDGEWTSFTIHESRTGWVVNYSTGISGCITGWRTLVPYGFRGYQRGQDLQAMHNESTGVWEVILWGNGRILRKGQVVR
jgi:hypothetical protein